MTPNEAPAQTGSEPWSTRARVVLTIMVLIVVMVVLTVAIPFLQSALEMYRHFN